MLEEIAERRDFVPSPAPDHLFRCTFCGSVIPSALSAADLGIEPGGSPDIGGMYPYAHCFCGAGRFVLCEATEWSESDGPESDGQVSDESVSDGSPPPTSAPGGQQAAPTAGPARAPLARFGSDTAAKVDAARYELLPVDRVRPNPDQPRRFFDAAALRGLADSIRTVGLLEDILVRPRGDGYEIVLGERRWRATQLAGVASIRAKVVDLDDDEVRSIALTENIQRVDLSAVEEAFSFKSYVDSGVTVGALGHDFGGMEDRVAERLRVLGSRYFIDYQQQRIDELTRTVADLRAERRQPAAYDVRIVAEADLAAALAEGFDLVGTLPSGQLALRRPMA